MNEQQRELYKLLKRNPYMSKQQLAEALSISKVKLNALLDQLENEGAIVGRAYILKEQKRVVAIGGANIDRKFYVEGGVQFATSNPSYMTESVGGVARNISENLSRLQYDVKLLSVIGHDQAGAVIEQASGGIDFQLTEKLVGYRTGSYTAVLNEMGELVIAMADMAIYELLTPALLQRHESILTSATGIVIDLNCAKQTIEYVQTLCLHHQIPLAVIPVSVPKMRHMPEQLEGITYFICNEEELEGYLQTTFENDFALNGAVEQLLERGAEHVIITLGERGAIAGTKKQIAHYRAYPVDTIKDVTGAGDAFVSGVLHGVMQGELFDEAVQLGLANAAATLQSQYTVRVDLTKKRLSHWRKQY